VALRYVVLRHEGAPGGTHFDVMIEREPGGKLRTWRAGSWPIGDGDNLEAIGDHRREYLEYEGEISGERGFVKRVAEGICEVAEEGAALVVRLADGGVFRAPKG
jgi:hypothetical protein